MCQPTRKVVCACSLRTYAQDNLQLISVEISLILNLARAKCEFSPLEFARAVPASYSLSILEFRPAFMNRDLPGLQRSRFGSIGK